MNNEQRANNTRYWNWLLENGHLTLKNAINNGLVNPNFKIKMSGLTGNNITLIKPKKDDGKLCRPISFQHKP